MRPAIPHKPFVVGLDEEGRSNDALLAALDLSKRLDVELFPVHALPVLLEALGPLGPVSEGDSGAGAIAVQAARVREQLLARLSGAVARSGLSVVDVQDRLRVLPGPPAKVLIDAAREHDASTIFLGPHRRRTGLDFGSTARAVLAHAAGSVWVQPARYEPIRRLLVPVDLSEDSSNALRVACFFARTYGASVTALHCFAPAEVGYAPGLGYPVLGSTHVLEETRSTTRQAFEKAMSGFDWSGIEHDWRFLDGRPVLTILELQEAYDLIALGSHGRTGLRSALLGNVACSILKESTRPVLVIRHPDRRFLP